MRAATLDELIGNLQRVRAEHGNLPCYHTEGDAGEEQHEDVCFDVEPEEHPDDKYLHLPKRLVF